MYRPPAHSHTYTHIISYYIWTISLSQHHTHGIAFDCTTFYLQRTESNESRSPRPFRLCLPRQFFRPDAVSALSCTHVLLLRLDNLSTRPAFPLFVYPPSQSIASTVLQHEAWICFRPLGVIPMPMSWRRSILFSTSPSIILTQPMSTLVHFFLFVH